MYRTFYVHAHAIRSISLYALSRLHIIAPIAAPIVRVLRQRTRNSSRRSLILYVQYIHFRFPGLHRRFRRARSDVDIDRLSARFKTGIISTRIWFGTPDGINIFVGNGGRRQHTSRRHEIRFSSVATWILLSRKEEKYSDFVFHNYFA